MKAYEVKEFGIEQLKITERPEPVPGKFDVLVRIFAASINYRDVMVVSGTYNPKMKLPAVPFSDGAGEVVAVGEGVTKWKPGDRVMPTLVQGWIYGEPSETKRRTSLGAGAQWDGVLREYGSFNEEGLVRIPDHLSYVEASTLPCAALTAWNALSVSGRLRPGESVLSLGTGGVSIFAAQFALLSGARVIVTSSSEEKIDRLRSLGDIETVNYRESPEWHENVLEMTGGRGVDHVVEVGGAGTLGNSIRAVRFGGHIALIGALTGAAGFDPISVFMKAIRLHGIFVGSRVMLEEMNRAVSVSKLQPVIDRVFDFEEVRDALHYVQKGSHFGKVVISIDKEQ